MFFRRGSLPLRSKASGFSATPSTGASPRNAPKQVKIANAIFPNHLTSTTAAFICNMGHLFRKTLLAWFLQRISLPQRRARTMPICPLTAARPGQCSVSLFVILASLSKPQDRNVLDFPNKGSG